MDHAGSARDVCFNTNLQTRLPPLVSLQIYIRTLRRAFCTFKPIGIYRNATRCDPPAGGPFRNVQNLLLYFNLKSIHDSQLYLHWRTHEFQEASYIDSSRAPLFIFICYTTPLVYDDNFMTTHEPIQATPWNEEMFL